MVCANEIGEPAPFDVMYDSGGLRVDRVGSEIAEVIAPGGHLFFGRRLARVLTPELSLIRPHQLSGHSPRSIVRDLTYRVRSERVVHTASNLALFAGYQPPDANQILSLRGHT